MKLLKARGRMKLGIREEFAENLMRRYTKGKKWHYYNDSLIYLKEGEKDHKSVVAEHYYPMLLKLFMEQNSFYFKNLGVLRKETSIFKMENWIACFLSMVKTQRPDLATQAEGLYRLTLTRGTTDVKKIRDCIWKEQKNAAEKARGQKQAHKNVVHKIKTTVSLGRTNYFRRESYEIMLEQLRKDRIFFTKGQKEQMKELLKFAVGEEDGKTILTRLLADARLPERERTDIQERFSRCQFSEEDFQQIVLFMESGTIQPKNTKKYLKEMNLYIDRLMENRTSRISRKQKMWEDLAFYIAANQINFGIFLENKKQVVDLLKIAGEEILQSFYETMKNHLFFQSNPIKQMEMGKREWVIAKLSHCPPDAYKKFADAILNNRFVCQRIQSQFQKEILSIGWDVTRPREEFYQKAIRNENQYTKREEIFSLILKDKKSLCQLLQFGSSKEIKEFSILLDQENLFKETGNRAKIHKDLTEKEKILYRIENGTEKEYEEYEAAIKIDKIKQWLYQWYKKQIQIRKEMVYPLFAGDRERFFNQTNHTPAALSVLHNKEEWTDLIENSSLREVFYFTDIMNQKNLFGVTKKDLEENQLRTGISRSSQEQLIYLFRYGTKEEYKEFIEAVLADSIVKTHTMECIENMVSLEKNQQGKFYYKWLYSQPEQKGENLVQELDFLKRQFLILTEQAKEQELGELLKWLETERGYKINSQGRKGSRDGAGFRMQMAALLNNMPEQVLGHIMQLLQKEDKTTWEAEVSERIIRRIRTSMESSSAGKPESRRQLHQWIRLLQKKWIRPQPWDANQRIGSFDPSIREYLAFREEAFPLAEIRNQLLEPIKQILEKKSEKEKEIILRYLSQSPKLSDQAAGNVKEPWEEYRGQEKGADKLIDLLEKEPWEALEMLLGIKNYESIEHESSLKGFRTRIAAFAAEEIRTKSKQAEEPAEKEPWDIQGRLRNTAAEILEGLGEEEGESILIHLSQSQRLKEVLKEEEKRQKAGTEEEASRWEEREGRLRLGSRERLVYLLEKEPGETLRMLLKGAGGPEESGNSLKGSEDGMTTATEEEIQTKSKQEEEPAEKEPWDIQGRLRSTAAEILEGLGEEEGESILIHLSQSQRLKEVLKEEEKRQKAGTEEEASRWEEREGRLRLGSRERLVYLLEKEPGETLRMLLKGAGGPEEPGNSLKGSEDGMTTATEEEIQTKSKQEEEPAEKEPWDIQGRLRSTAAGILEGLGEEEGESILIHLSQSQRLKEVLKEEEKRQKAGTEEEASRWEEREGRLRLGSRERLVYLLEKEPGETLRMLLEEAGGPEESGNSLKGSEDGITSTTEEEIQTKSKQEEEPAEKEPWDIQGRLRSTAAEILEGLGEEEGESIFIHLSQSQRLKEVLEEEEKRRKAGTEGEESHWEEGEGRLRLGSRERLVYLLEKEPGETLRMLLEEAGGPEESGNSLKGSEDRIITAVIEEIRTKLKQEENLVTGILERLDEKEKENILIYLSRSEKLREVLKKAEKEPEAIWGPLLEPAADIIEKDKKTIGDRLVYLLEKEPGETLRMFLEEQKSETRILTSTAAEAQGYLNSLLELLQVRQKESNEGIPLKLKELLPLEERRRILWKDVFRKGKRLSAEDAETIRKKRLHGWKSKIGNEENIEPGFFGWETISTVYRETQAAPSREEIEKISGNQETSLIKMRNVNETINRAGQEIKQVKEEIKLQKKTVEELIKQMEGIEQKSQQNTEKIIKRIMGQEERNRYLKRLSHGFE